MISLASVAISLAVGLFILVGEAYGQTVNGIKQQPPTYSTYEGCLDYWNKTDTLYFGPNISVRERNMSAYYLCETMKEYLHDKNE